MKAGHGELQGNRGDIHGIGFSGIAHEKASATTPGFQMHCNKRELSPFVNLLSEGATAWGLPVINTGRLLK